MASAVEGSGLVKGDGHPRPNATTMTESERAGTTPSTSQGEKSSGSAIFPRPRGTLESPGPSAAVGPSAHDGNDCPNQRDHMLPTHRSFFEELIASDSLFWHAQRQDAEHYYEVFEKNVSTYQEQPQLLDPVLEGLVGRLASALLDACKGALASIHEGAHEGDGGGDATPPLSLESSVIASSALENASYISRYLWKVSTTRGYKAVLRFMPCDVFSVEPVIRFLNTARRDSRMSWECQYVLVMWSSQLVMVPFEFGVVCATQGDHEDADVIVGLLRTCKDLLRSASKCRDMAAVCLGRLLTRPDMAEALLEFGTWAEGHLAKGDAMSVTSPTEPSMPSLSRQFLLPGISLAVATIFKFGKADDATIRALVTRFLPVAVELYDSTECRHNPLVRKLSMKIVQRGATLIITASEVNLDEGGVEEILGAAVMALLSGLDDRDTIVRWSAAKGVGRLAAKLQADFADQLLDSIIDRYLSDVTTGEDAWHGGCLAVAELARRELIESRRVDCLIPAIRGGLEYDVRRGYTSVGANVRDAAAYVCWALARTQSREDMASALQTLAPVLMTTACYDREVNCRRAASAAFQECVGRLGDFPHGIEILTVADYFSVSLRTSAYLDVAPLVAAFEGYHLTFAEHLTNAKLGHWDKSVRELAAEALARLVPIDPEYHRTSTVGRLANACLESSAQDATHGATLGLACLLLAIRKEADGPFDTGTGGMVMEAVLHLAKTFSLHGSASTLAGGENMRSALCRLIQSVCISGVSSTSTVSGKSRGQLKCMYDVCRENLRHPLDTVQNDAARALAALLDTHIDDPKFPAPLQDVVAGITGDLHPDLHFGARRGAALAFGQLPSRLIYRSKDVVFDAVSAAIYPEEQLAVRDVETRVNAIRSLPHVVRSILGSCGRHGTGHGGKCIDHNLRQRALDALLIALEDYSTDNRGDIGSWAREAAASAGVDLLLDAASQHGTKAFATEASEGSDSSVGVLIVDRVHLFVAKLARLTLERIGRVRSVAGRCLERVLSDHSLASVLRLPDAFVESASELSEEELLDGRAASRILPGCLIRARQDQPGRDSAGLVTGRCGGLADHLASEALLGAVYAIGGLDADLREFTAIQLVSCIKELLDSGSCGSHDPIGALYLSLWRPRAKSARLSGPFVQTTDTILSGTDLILDEQFLITAVDVTLETIHGSSDVAKLSRASSLLGTVAGEDVSDEAKASAAMGLVALMGRKYPKVRLVAAGELYTAMLFWDEMIVEPDQDLFSILTATPWGASTAPLIREQRLRLREKLTSMLNTQ